MTIQRVCRYVSESSPLRAGLIIFVIALLVRLTFLFVFHTYRDLSRVELERTAISLVTRGVYGNPYAIPTGPTAHVAPGYTLILAAIFKIFGMGIPGEIVKRLLATLVSCLLWALLPAVADRFGIARSAGIIAGLIGAIYPARPLVEIEGDWETPYTALALVLIAVLSVSLWRKRELSLQRAAWHGLLWGVSLLFVPALLDIFIVFIAVGYLFCREAGPRRYLLFAAVEVLVAVACLLPWIIRNERALGSPIVTRTNLGIELNISNNDDASPDQRVNFLHGLFEKYHPLLSKSEAAKVRDLGEVEYNKLASAKAKQWMRDHPQRFFELCLGRLRCYWFYYDPTSLAKTAILALTTLLGFAGFCYLLREDVVLSAVLGLILLLYPLPNYLVHVGLRQEYPLHWLLTLLGVYFVIRLVRTRSGVRH